MNISYCITTHNEIETLERLLNQLLKYLEPGDEIIVIDDYSDNKETLNLFAFYKNIQVIKHKLNKNYGEHKNEFGKYAKGDFILQLDGDELPSIELLLNIKEIIHMNPAIELFLIPRINDFWGVTPEHAKQWNWKLTESERYKTPIVNFPDFQGRLYKNDPSRIKWSGRLHEKISGANSFCVICQDETLSLYHFKFIEKQVADNLRYNKDFTPQENQGHKIV